MSAPTADSALAFKPGRYSLDIRDGAVAIMCAECTESLAFHADPVGFDEIAEDVWRHEKVHAHD